MRAVVTGGAGFIGSHVVDALVERGDEVHVVDDFSTGRRENVTAATVHEHDIREPLDGLFDEIRPELVVHLAAQADVGTSVAQPVLRRRGERPRNAERPRGRAPARRAARLQLHRRRDLRRVRPPGARGRRAPAALALRHREARGRGVPGHVESSLREPPSRAPVRERLRAAAAPEARGRRRRDLHGPAARGRRGDDLRRRRPDARLRLRRRRRRGDPRRRRAGRRRLQRRHRDGDVRQRALRGDLPHGGSRSRRALCACPHRRRAPQRARRLPQRARARLAAADVAGRGPPSTWG